MASGYAVFCRRGGNGFSEILWGEAFGKLKIGLRIVYFSGKISCVIRMINVRACLGSDGKRAVTYKAMPRSTYVITSFYIFPELSQIIVSRVLWSSHTPVENLSLKASMMKDSVILTAFQNYL